MENKSAYEEEARKIIEISMEAAVNLMDDEIREQLHQKMAPCSDLEFLTAYLEEHFKKYGQKFVIG